MLMLLTSIILMFYITVAEQDKGKKTKKASTAT